MFNSLACLAAKALLPIATKPCQQVQFNLQPVLAQIRSVSGPSVPGEQKSMLPKTTKRMPQ